MSPLNGSVIPSKLWQSYEILLRNDPGSRVNVNALKDQHGNNCDPHCGREGSGQCPKARVGLWPGHQEMYEDRRPRSRWVRILVFVHREPHTGERKIRSVFDDLTHHTADPFFSILMAEPGSPGSRKAD